MRPGYIIRNFIRNFALFARLRALDNEPVWLYIIQHGLVDWKLILKRITPLLLVVLALLSLVQRPACCCQQTEALPQSAAAGTDCKSGQAGDCQQSFPAERLLAASAHSCCQVKPAVTSSSPCPSGYIQALKHCCGMIGQPAIATATSLPLSGHQGQPRSERCFTLNFIALTALACRQGQSLVNRAPPRLSGFGTSDTYLFKRTLLI